MSDAPLSQSAPLERLDDRVEASRVHRVEIGRVRDR